MVELKKEDYTLIDNDSQIHRCGLCVFNEGELPIGHERIRCDYNYNEISKQIGSCGDENKYFVLTKQIGEVW